MIIYTDHNGVAVNALCTLSDGTDVEGHEYQVLSGPKTTQVSFQRGGVVANGVNGLTNETLLNIIIHRTKFLNSKFPCHENELAMYHMQFALNELENRTLNRINRDVEGKEIL